LEALQLATAVEIRPAGLSGASWQKGGRAYQRPCGLSLYAFVTFAYSNLSILNSRSNVQNALVYAIQKFSVTV